MLQVKACIVFLFCLTLALASNRTYPITNFTMNCLRGLDLGNVTSKYPICVDAINTTLVKSLDLMQDYKERGLDGLMDTITMILSQLYDLNSTCQLCVHDLAKALQEYMRKFRDDNYLEAVLREFIWKADLWITHTRRFKSCIYYSQFGCAGFATGKFMNIVFNATPKNKSEDENPAILPTQSPYYSFFDNLQLNSTLVRIIVNATFNALHTSGLLSSKNATKACKESAEQFYARTLEMISVIIDQKDYMEGLAILLKALKHSNTIYRHCKKTFFESLNIATVYLSTFKQPEKLGLNIVFRSKPLMMRGMKAAQSLIDSQIEDFGVHIGYLLNHWLWP